MRGELREERSHPQTTTDPTPSRRLGMASPVRDRAAAVPGQLRRSPGVPMTTASWSRGKSTPMALASRLSLPMIRANRRAA